VGKPKAPDYQHFLLKHEKTGHEVQIYIGPMPIGGLEMERLVKAAYKEKGLKYKDAWNIEKAWVGPKDSRPPKVPKSALGEGGGR